MDGEQPKCERCDEAGGACREPHNALPPFPAVLRQAEYHRVAASGRAAYWPFHQR